MDKKTGLSSAPKPKLISDAKVDSYVTSGLGHDTAVGAHATSTATGKVEKGAMKRLSLDLTPELHTRFKTACSANGLKMAEQLVKIIQDRTEDLKKRQDLAEANDHIGHIPHLWF
jgi:hypothetical protein